MKGRVVAGGGGLREDEKKADRERETPAGDARAAYGFTTGAGAETLTRGVVRKGAGRRGGRRSFADVVEDEPRAGVYEE